MQLLAGLLLISSIVSAVVGLALLTPATLGVGIVVLACYLGILTRIIQAAK